MVEPICSALTGKPYTADIAIKVADGMQKALDEKHPYVPTHKHPAYRARIAHLRAWAAFCAN